MLNQCAVFSTLGFRRFGFGLSLIVCATLMVGCGGDPNIGYVSGKITINGEPLEGAYVTFTPTRSEGTGSTSFGKTASDGTYSMVLSESQEGVYTGENLVRIKTGDVTPDEGRVIEETVPNVYNSKSNLLKEVKSGSNTFDFKLESTSSTKIDKQVDMDR